MKSEYDKIILVRKKEVAFVRAMKTFFANIGIGYFLGYEFKWDSMWPYITGSALFSIFNFIYQLRKLKKK